MATYNANVMLHAPSAAPAVPMGLATAPVTEAEMERRRRKACKHGRTKAGRCRKRPR